MKFSVTENDKSTAMDELILTIISIVCLAIGILLAVLRPTVWVINESMVVVAGVMFILVGVMFIPCVIYRLFTNDKK
jgi:hypothetical protein